LPDKSADSARFLHLAQTLVTASPDALIAISPTGEVLFSNKAAESIFGYAESEAVGRSIFDLVVPIDRVEERRKAITATIETAPPPMSPYAARRMAASSSTTSPIGSFATRAATSISSSSAKRD
jgi:PAS domain-containing protein